MFRFLVRSQRRQKTDVGDDDVGLDPDLVHRLGADEVPRSGATVSRWAAERRLCHHRLRRRRALRLLFKHTIAFAAENCPARTGVVDRAGPLRPDPKERERERREESKAHSLTAPISWILQTLVFLLRCRLRIGMDRGELTAQETALYDRQIRMWGVDAQKRLSKAHILVSGLSGTAVEFCKNIVLAGVGSLTLMDDRMVTEDVLEANFLIPLDETKYSGRSLSELCCDSLRDFNPMVHVSVEKGDLAQFDGEFFDKFDAVVVSCCSLKIKKAINEKCRKRSKRIAFYTVECRDSCGEIFVDLQNYTYAQKKPDGTAECHLNYPSLEEAISIPWSDLPRKVAKLYFAMRVMERFELSERHNPGEMCVSGLPVVLKLRKELCDAQSLSESHIPAGLLERLLAAGSKEHPPVCAILGGILGQEVIKAISGKGDPLKNFFYFDAADGKGVIEDISTLSAS